ncbi:hypothetical protein Cylst_0244 [Cylindrospermum stagnale PCC 7417]|uniref:Uncharacterized protein n=1 Tax=Cylindrospermum stagnale PCC 7417 TaxID=56107 RepID=K9WR24_9NOST|nr:hypothetical protein Cylst_0244 [Cylindrospermum stagnale PCC 7417]
MGIGYWVMGNPSDPQSPISNTQSLIPEDEIFSETR